MAWPGRHGLYALEDTGGARQEVRGQFQRVLAQLASFPATCTRLRGFFRKEVPVPSSEAERPTPVPIPLGVLLEVVQRRLELGPQWAHLPAQPQAAFRDIILAEVRHCFKDLQRSLHDPAFGAQANRDLYRSLVTYVVLVCEQLFLHYLRLLDHRRRLVVFTDAANLTRFSAQLTLDCSTFLDLATVRRRLVLEMKAAARAGRRSELGHRPLVPPSPSAKETLGGSLGFTIGYFLRLTKPYTPTARKKVAEDIKELDSLPPLDMSKVTRMKLPTPQDIAFLRQVAQAVAKLPCPPSPSVERAKAQRAKRAAPTSLKRSQSLPTMRAGRLLADELGIRIRVRPLSPHLPCHSAGTAEGGELRGPKRLAADLHRLAQGCGPGESGQRRQQQRAAPEEALELPPLIKALTRRRANELHQEQLQAALGALQREEYAERERRDTLIAAPATHPQAATTDLRVLDRMVAKAADVQVSDRVFREAVALDKYPPVYNHLLGEISSAAVKSLDASLSTGEEVREMYKELANTISEDHLRFDVGPSVEPPAAGVDFSGCFASSTLTKRKTERVLNEELSRILPAGPYSPEEVVDTAQTPSLPFKKKASKKEYASWLKWWKKTFNTDDYLTYVGNKESDYLAVIFHLYNFAAAEEEEEKPQPQPAPVDMAAVKKLQQAQKAARKEVARLPTKVDLKAGHPKGIAKRTGASPDVAASPDVGEPDQAKVWEQGPGASGTPDHKPEDLRALQRRLERLWTVLHFTERQRMDMALKYGSHPYYLMLPDMLQAWEEAARSIQDREVLLAELERFEQSASDPNRLFSLEPQAYARRLQEEQRRNRLRSELDQYDSELYVILTHIREAFDDTVTFKGRPYLEKMEWDTVEMLYWLQQERRAHALSRAVRNGVHRWKLPPLD